ESPVGPEGSESPVGPIFILQPSSFSLHPSAFSLQPSAFILLPSSFCLHPLFSWIGNPMSGKIGETFSRGKCYEIFENSRMDSRRSADFTCCCAPRFADCSIDRLGAARYPFRCQ